MCAVANSSTNEKLDASNFIKGVSVLFVTTLDVNSNGFHFLEQAIGHIPLRGWRDHEVVRSPQVKASYEGVKKTFMYRKVIWSSYTDYVTQCSKLPKANELYD